MNETDIQSPRILLVEDRLSLARCYAEFLSDEYCEVIHVGTGADALKELQAKVPALILLDLQLPDMNGMQILEYIKRKQIPLAVVVITAHGSFETSRMVMQLGAIDYLEKPFTRDRLCVTVRNALKRRQLESAVSNYRLGFCDFVGSSVVMQGVYRIIESAAKSSATVFITGESGTGKEICAQAIHKLSDRNEMTCVTLNCAAIPRDLMESEIFGHVKGAFTGAVAQREGAASRANGGTLFLDEIGEMDLDLQSKLLRFVQTGQFQKVGSNMVETVNVRFVCATNRNPLEQVKAGTFREDLYYRLHVVPIHLPPLRERDRDVIDIAEKVLTQFAEEENKNFRSLSRETEKFFLRYPWPGNVRQLLNVMRNIVVLHDGEVILPGMLPSPLDLYDLGEGEKKREFNAPALQVVEPRKPVGIKAEQDIRPLWMVESEAIEEAIEICGGSITRAARYLELSPSTIYRKRSAWEKERLSVLVSAKY